MFNEEVHTTAGLSVSVECVAQVIASNQNTVPTNLFPPLTYQWFLTISCLSTVASLTKNLTFSPVRTSNAGTYDCIPTLSIPQLDISIREFALGDIDATIRVISKTQFTTITRM